MVYLIKVKLVKKIEFPPRLSTGTSCNPRASKIGRKKVSKNKNQKDEKSSFFVGIIKV